MAGPRKSASRIKPLPVAAAVVALCLLGLDFASNRPFFEHHRRFLYLEPDTKKILIISNVPFSSAQVIRQDGGQPRILLDSQGFGFFNARRKLTDKREMKGDALIERYHIEEVGRFSELNHYIKVILPESLPADISVSFEAPAAS